MTTLASRRTRSRGDDRREQLWVDVPFTKAPTATRKGDLELSGYASTWGMDRDEEMVATTAFDDSLGEYLAKNPMLLWQHNPDWPIGSVSSGTTDETGLYVTAIVPNPGPDAADWQKGAYTSIKNGIVRTFSIGGYFERDVKQGPDGPLFYIVRIELFETSCVSIPANADSIYEAAVKALNGGPGHLSDKATTQMEQLLGFGELTDPELRGMSDDEKAERYDALAAIFEDVHGVEPPGYDDFRRIEAARDAGLSPLKTAPALSLIAKSFYMPAADEKAGRAVSAANRERLETALSEHDALEGKMVDAAEAMKEAADHHANAIASIKEVLGVPDEAPPDPDEDEMEDEESPEKAPSDAPDVKQLTYDLFARLSDAGGDRFGRDDLGSDEYLYVYVDDFDLDEGYVVYCVYDNGSRSFWQVSFTRGDDGSVALAAGQEEVAPKTGYVPKSAASPAAKAPTEEPEDGAADPEAEDGKPAAEASESGEKGALAAPSGSFAPRETSWSGSNADKRIRTWAGAEDAPNAKYARAFLYCEGGASSESFGDYKYGVADIVDGDFKLVFKGVTAAGQRAKQQGLSAIYPAIRTLYSRAASQFDDDSIESPV